MSTTRDHTLLCQQILIAIGSEPGIIAGLNPCGQAVHETNGRIWRQNYGWPHHEGSPDILVVFAPHGRLVGLEVKTGKSNVTAVQRANHKALDAVGVRVYVVRSVRDAERAIYNERGFY